MTDRTKLEHVLVCLAVAAALVLVACKKQPPHATLVSGCRGSAEGGTRDATRGPAHETKVEGPPTYHGRIAAILESRCVSCHAPNGIGPFSLRTYEEARAKHHEIADAVHDREMPPWLPETASCSKLRHSRALTADEIQAIDAWAKAEAPEGKREDYRAPPVTRTYDAVAEPPDRSVAPAIAYAPKPPAVLGRGDDYHCFVLEPAIEKRENIVALRVVPGAARLVHHVILYEVRASGLDKIKERDDAEPGPGYTCFGGIGVQPTVRRGNVEKGELVDFDSQMIAAWAPGGGATDVAGGATALPKGTAIRLAPGSKLVLQVHYSLENYVKGMSDKTRVDMWLANGAPAKQAVWVPLLKYDFRVPPGVGPDDPRASATGEAALPFPLTVLGVAGHMHLRGKSIRVDALGDQENPGACLLDIPRWEFGHQEAYWLTEGVSVDRASITCKWDNRAEAQPSVSGKQKKTKELRWGEGTDDEMCLAFLYATL